MSSAHKSHVIGIAGGSGAGKSSVAAALAERLAPDALVVSLDSYYRLPTIQQERALGFSYWDTPDAIDFLGLCRDLDTLKAGGSIQGRAYDYTVHQTFLSEHRIEARFWVIVEGALLFADHEARQRFDTRVFLSTGEKTRLDRRILRDCNERAQRVSTVISQFFDSINPLTTLHVLPTARYADLLLSGEDPVNQIVDELCRRCCISRTADMDDGGATQSLPNR
jgi:uridine kinase